MLRTTKQEKDQSVRRMLRKRTQILLRNTRHTPVIPDQTELDVLSNLSRIGHELTKHDSLPPIPSQG